MKHRFVHEFEDDPPLSDFEVDLDAPQGARIKFDLIGEEIWLSADRAGWLHLARICSEMALHTSFEPGYHFHRSYDWEDFPARRRMVSFELSEEKDPA
jgi:hypothetical protein